MIRKQPACNGGAMCRQAKRAHRDAIRRETTVFFELASGDRALKT
jgi:hypothetical protein